MRHMANDPDEEIESPDESPPSPPYAPDPRLIDLIERGSHMTDEEAREALRRDSAR